MENQEQKSVNVSLIKCTETKVEFIPSALAECSSDDIKYQFKFGFKKGTANEVHVRIYVICHCGSTMVLKHESEYVFDVLSLDEVIVFHKDGVSDNANIIPTLIGVAYGTTRGMIAVRSANTLLENRPLPMINTNQFANLLKNVHTEVDEEE